MTAEGRRRNIENWQGQTIPPGQSRDLFIAVGESYSGITVQIPIHVRRAAEEGPTVFVTAALHGDEINGTGAIRKLIHDPNFQLCRGNVIFVPVLNMLGFDRHSRYLPDRRDLNRVFPGSDSGSLASRMARRIFDEIVLRSDYGIDLHTAARRRTNYPNVRGDLTNPTLREISIAFGCEVIINAKGPTGSLRREATKAGCPTIVVEGGEVSKVEPVIVESAARGVINMLSHLKMVQQTEERPDYQIIVNHSKWVRAEKGGFLHFHVKPGDIIEKGQPIATNTTILGHDHTTVFSPFAAVVIGMTTLPAISPGDPICNLGRLPKSKSPSEIRRIRSEQGGLEERAVEELASNVLVTEPHSPSASQTKRD